MEIAVFQFLVPAGHSNRTVAEWKWKKGRKAERKSNSNRTVAEWK